MAYIVPPLAVLQSPDLPIFIIIPHTTMISTSDDQHDIEHYIVSSGLPTHDRALRLSSAQPV